MASRSVRRSAASGRFISHAGPKTGSRVRVPFGRHVTEGVVTGRSITGRYNVKVNVTGADPVTSSYSLNELRTI